MSLFLPIHVGVAPLVDCVARGAAFHAGADPNLLFTWDRARGDAILAKFAALDPSSTSTSVLSSEDLRQALMTALFYAEQLAVAAGLSVAIPTNDGSNKGPGVILGAGLDRARANPNAPGAREYLATFDAVSAAAKNISTAGPNELPTIDPPQQTAITLVAALFYLAVVAIIAGAAVGIAHVVSRNSNLADVAIFAKRADEARIRGLPIPDQPDRSTSAASAIPWTMLGLIAGGALLVTFLRH